MTKVKVELWCVQEDLHLADVEVEAGEVLNEKRIKKGIRITEPAHRRRLPLQKGIVDSEVMHCRACTCALVFFVAGTAKGKVPLEQVEVLDAPKAAHLFDTQVEPQEGTMLAQWVRVKKPLDQEVNVRSVQTVGVVIGHDLDSGVLTLESRNTFMAVPGLGRVLS